MDAEIRVYTDSDRAEFIKLRSKLLSKISTKKFKWKYEDNPLSESPQIIVAYDNGSLVGAVGNFSVPLRIGKKRIIAGQPVDVIIREDYRSLRLFTRLIEKLREVFFHGNIDAEFGIPRSESRVLWNRFMGWEFCRIEKNIRIQHPAKLLSGRVNSRTISALTYLMGLPFRANTYLKNLTNENDGVHLRVKRKSGYFHEAVRFDPKSEYKVRVDRSREFWDWRIRDPDVEANTYWVGNKSHPIASALVLEYFPYKISEVTLEWCDESKNGSILALMKLYRKVMREYSHSSLIQIPPSATAEIARRVGITHTRSIRTFTEGRFGDVASNYLGIDIRRITEWRVGWKWLNGERQKKLKTYPPTNWEFSQALKG